MAYRALYRTYRPSTFNDVVGQQHIVLTLQNAISKNKIAHAYLFCGPRGTGKTTIAKLVAKGVNCTSKDNVPCNECHHCKSIATGSHPDIIEIDAASNNGVDEIRDLIEKVKYSPIEAKYKVYIIDEVHMLSTGAFNALLKTLEEPPSHVIFILATTEPHKVLPTIISRCQRFDFSKVPPKQIADRVEYVLQTENISYEKEVVRIISTLAEGGLRDALSILEQVIAYAKDDLRQEHVHQIYGITTIKEKIDLLDAIFSYDINRLLEQLTTIENKSHDIKRLTADLIDILKEAIVFSYTNDEQVLHIINKLEASDLIKEKSTDTLLDMIDVLIDTYEKYRNATNVHAYFEVALLRIMNLSTSKQHINNVPKEMQVIENDEDKAQLTEEQSDKHIKNTLSVQDVTEANTKQQDEGHTAVKVVEETLFDSNEPTLDLRNYSIDELVACMVAADKPMRMRDIENWKQIEEYEHDLKFVKVVSLVTPSEIIISGEKFIVVIVKNQETADMINETDNDVLYKELTKKVLLTPKHVIAITKETFDEAFAQFQKRRDNNSLPNPIEIKEVKETISKEKSAKEKAIDLFGEEIVEVSED